MAVVDLNQSFQGLFIIMFIFACVYVFMKYSTMKNNDRNNR